LDKADLYADALHMHMNVLEGVLGGRASGVLGFDNFNEYYPSTLKRDRQAQLELNNVCVPAAHPALKSGPISSAPTAVAVPTDAVPPRPEGAMQICCCLRERERSATGFAGLWWRLDEFLSLF
jgi:hypothetical protein